MDISRVGSIGDYIRQQRQQARISLRQLAAQAGVSNPYLSQIERGLRKPSAEILNQIAKGLRISAEALYVQAGLIEQRQPDSTVLNALRADTTITERQRQVLMDIYDSFRKENRAGTPGQAAQPSQKAQAVDPEPLRGDVVLVEELLVTPPTASQEDGRWNGHVTPETEEG
ncbi:MAG TPA: helix-turn-helix transcriptional regulator [Thermopolyspora sp.]|jgi:Predicted transcriptional regulators